MKELRTLKLRTLKGKRKLRKPKTRIGKSFKAARDVFAKQFSKEERAKKAFALKIKVDDATLNALDEAAKKYKEQEQQEYEQEEQEQ